MIFLYATFAVLEEHVSPPYTQQVPLLQSAGSTFLFKDAPYPIAVQENTEYKEAELTDIDSEQPPQNTHLLQSLQSYSIFQKGPIIC